MIIICDLKLLRCSLYKHCCLFLTPCCQPCWISLLNVVSDCYNLKNRSLSLLSFPSLPACCQHCMKAASHTSSTVTLWLQRYQVKSIFIFDFVMITELLLWFLHPTISCRHNSEIGFLFIFFCKYRIQTQTPESKQYRHTEDKFIIFYQSIDMQQMHTALNLNLVSCICPQALMTNDPTLTVLFKSIFNINNKSVVFN